MTESRADLAAALRERGVIRAAEDVLAVWSGRLVDAGGDSGVALLGVTRTQGHLLSRAGLLTFPLATSRAFVRGRTHLGVSTTADGGAEVTVWLSIDSPVAIAEQINEMSRGDGAGATADDQAAARPKAKRRAGG